MTPDEAKLIFATVKENHGRLNACAKHHFPKLDSYPLGGKVTCENCGGKLSLTDIGYYAKGYTAAGGDANDILEGLGAKQ